MRTIRGLQVRHIRGARRVDIHHPDPAGTVEVAGDNGSGKSSTLDAIEWGIRGKRALPEDPLHHGATQGHVELDLGDLRITRRITEANAARGGTVQIRAADGSKWGQRDIEELYGAWTFDPLAFARAKPEDQAAQIRVLAGADFCSRLQQLDADIAAARQHRTDAGRLERSYGRLEQPVHVEPIDTSAVMAELQQATAHNEAQAKAGAEVEQHKAKVAMAVDNLRAAEERLAKALADVTQAEQQIALLKDAFPPEPEPTISVSGLEARLAQASEQNAAAARYQRALEEFGKWQAASRAHARLDQEVRELEEQRRQHLRTAELPVDGLSWEGGKIALHGTPFAGLSTTEQLLLSARIGMAMSPDLRVMLIREGGLIDDAKFLALRELAQQEKYQVWVETAGDGHTPDALVIHTGELDDTAQEWTE